MQMALCNRDRGMREYDGLLPECTKERDIRYHAAAHPHIQLPYHTVFWDRG